MSDSVKKGSKTKARRKKESQSRLVLWIAVAAIAVVLVVAFFVFRNRPASPQLSTGPNPETTVSPTGLQIEDLAVGTGDSAQAGDTVTVHYTGWLPDGTKFDSSVDRNQPYTFLLGAQNVIPGWDEGVAGMRVGGKRRLVIPPELAYGEQGFSGVIPPNATLIFEVELLGTE